MKGKPKQYVNMLRKLGKKRKKNTEIMQLKNVMQEKISKQVKNDNQYPSLKRESYFTFKIKQSKNHTRKTKEL